KRVERRKDSVVHLFMTGLRHTWFVRKWFKAVFVSISPFVLSIDLASQSNATNSAPTDLIIVGAGISGLSAALEVARSGASVTVVDGWSVFGGHAIMSSGMVCFVGTPEQEASHVKD